MGDRVCQCDQFRMSGFDIGFPCEIGFSFIRCELFRRGAGRSGKLHWSQTGLNMDLEPDGVLWGVPDPFCIFSGSIGEDPMGLRVESHGMDLLFSGLRYRERDPEKCSPLWIFPLKAMAELVVQTQGLARGLGGKRIHATPEENNGEEKTHGYMRALY